MTQATLSFILSNWAVVCQPRAEIKRGCFQPSHTLNCQWAQYPCPLPLPSSLQSSETCAPALQHCWCTYGQSWGALGYCIQRTVIFWFFFKWVGEFSSAATAKLQHFPSLSTASYSTYLKPGTRKIVAQDSNYQLERISKQYKLDLACPTNIIHVTVFSFQIRI